MLSGRKLLAKLLSVLLVVGTLAVDSSQAFKEERHSYRNFKLIRINPENEAALVYLLSLYNDQSPYLLDFWQPPTHVGAVVDLTVAPSDAASLVRDLSARGIHYIVAINDLQKAIESERSMAYAPGHGHMAAAHPIRDEFSYERYNSLADIHGELKRLKKEKPNLITLIDIGQTHENNTLLVIKIGGSREPPEKSSIWLDAGIHAREWIAPSTAMYIIRELVQGYDRDPSLQALLDHTPFYVLPVMNPDGYEFSRTQSPLPEV